MINISIEDFIKVYKPGTLMLINDPVITDFHFGFHEGSIENNEFMSFMPKIWLTFEKDKDVMMYLGFRLATNDDFGHVDLFFLYNKKIYGSKWKQLEQKMNFEVLS